MTGEQIYLNYYDTLAKATRLEELAHSLRSNAIMLEENTASCISTGWEGHTMNEFAKKNMRYCEKVNAHAHKLEVCAGLLRCAAQEYYRTEMAMLSIIGG